METVQTGEEIKGLSELLEAIRERLGDPRTPQADMERLTELEEEIERELNAIAIISNDRRETRGNE